MVCEWGIEVLSPEPSQPLLMTIPLRIENALFEPLRQYALDNNLGDRVGVAAKNLVSEGLASRGYLQKGPEGPGA